MSTITAAPQQALTVAQLTAQIKDLMEGEFPSIWVAGEISNFAQPQSGHCYFSLKDDRAQIRAVVWKSTAQRLKFDLRDGQEVVCHGHLDVYAPRGSYQLVIDNIQPQGVGALELALRKLREQLAKEGLFDRSRKRPLPTFPRRIAVVTSPTGAAIRDFLEVLCRRWRGVAVLVIPARVQGVGAAAEIVAGIRTANQLRPLPDVLVVGRGGGSLEDLWAFNEEPVVRAIAASNVPTVSAVGHEIDVTLSDMAADVRALTPSEAAELIVPSAQEVTARIEGHRQRLWSTARRYVDTARTRVDAFTCARPFRRPWDIVHDRSRRLDELANYVHASMRRVKTERASRLAQMAAKLDSLSPLAVLQRGYSIVLDERSQRIIRSAAQLQVGQTIVTRFAVGEATSEIRELAEE